MDKTVKELRAEWVKALRSGAYKQAKGALCKDSGYCCLGVAGKVIGISDENLIESNENEANTSYDRIQQAFGLQNTLGIYADSEALYSLNDHSDYDFKMIADVIESEPEGLFIDE